MGFEAKMLMHGTIESEAMIIPPLAAHSYSQHLCSIETKDYILSMDYNLDYVIHKKVEGKLVRISSIMRFPNSIDIAGTIYSILGEVTESRLWQWGPPLSPIGTDNQVISFYTNASVGAVVLCYDITDDGLVQKSSQVFDTTISSTNLFYSIYNNHIVVTVPYNSYEKASGSTYNCKFGFSSYIGELTTEGLLLEVLTAPEYKVTKDRCEYTNSYSATYCAVIYDDDKAYVGMYCNTTTSDMEYSTYLRRVTLSTKSTTSCTKSHTGSVLLGSSTEYQGPRAFNSAYILRTPSYTLIGNSWYIDTSGKIYTSGGVGLQGYGWSCIISQPHRKNPINYVGSNVPSMVLEQEDGSLSTFLIKDSRQPYAGLDNTANGITARGFTGEFYRVTDVNSTENPNTGRTYYNYIVPATLNSTDNTLEINSELCSNIKYTCPSDKYTQITSIHLIPENVDRSQNILLYANGELITRYKVLGEDHRTYANCPMVFDPGTVLEFRAICALAPIHITLFGIEEDV